MVKPIRWSPRSVDQLGDICNYIAKDSEFYAGLFAKKINAIVKSIPHFPQSGRIVPEYGDEKIREKIYENYRIVYRLKDEVIEIVAICHSAMLFSIKGH